MIFYGKSAFEKYVESLSGDIRSDYESLFYTRCYPSSLAGAKTFSEIF